MIKISLPKKGMVGDWLDLKEGGKVKIDYPQKGQVHKLQNKFAIDSDDDTLLRASMLDYMREYLRYTIKDWDGLFTDENNKPLDCILHKNALDEDLWYAITQDMDLTASLYNQIEEKLRWSFKDKKKLSSPTDLDTKGS